MPTPTTASGTGASLPLLGLKQTPAAAVPRQVIPKNASPARTIVPAALGLRECTQERQTIGAATAHAAWGGLMQDEGLTLDEDLTPRGGPDAGGRA